MICRLTRPSGPTGRAVTAQGHPRAIFKRAIERGNVVVAEATALKTAFGSYRFRRNRILPSGERRK
jgi:hypothetical protein